MRSRSRTRSVLRCAPLVLALSVPASAGAAERFYGVTESNRLVTFNSDSPGALRASRPIRGLRPGEHILGIDLRPSDGRLYAVGTASRLYTIDPRRGRARVIGSTPFGVSLRGHSLGFDFNPAADRLRLVTDAGRNFRLGPSTGRLIDGDLSLAGVQRDRDLSYEANDPAAGKQPRVGSSAYTANAKAPGSTRLFGIDSARDTLVRQDPPNEGVLSSVGRLGIDVREPAGFDVARSGRAYAGLRPAGARVGLYRVKLGSGRATRAASHNAIGTYVGRRSDPVRALAAAGRVANDRTPPRVRNLGNERPLIRELVAGRRLQITLSCNEACRASAVLLLGRRTVGRATDDVLGRAGRVKLRLGLSPRGRALVRRVRPRVLRIAFSAVDAAGNAVRSRRPR